MQATNHPSVRVPSLLRRSCSAICCCWQNNRRSRWLPMNRHSNPHLDASEPYTAPPFLPGRQACDLPRSSITASCSLSAATPIQTFRNLCRQISFSEKTSDTFDSVHRKLPSPARSEERRVGKECR